VKELLEILEDAIKKEVAANKLYTEAAAKAETSEARSLLERLAAEERVHKQLLLGLYERLAGRAAALDEYFEE
jgi:rubrerythrin